LFIYITDQFFVDKCLWYFYGITPTNHVVGKFVLEDLECYKDTQMKGYDITKLTTELKSDNSPEILSLFCFGSVNRSLPDALH